jgi:RimJ/RimL family protein N-acetyltransferase
VFPERVQTARLALERWDSARDTPGFAQLCADPRVMRFLQGPIDGDGAAEVSLRLAGHWVRHGFGLWAVRLGDDSELLGFAGLMHLGWLPGWEDRVEVGWRLRHSAWGHGYATEGARAGLEHAPAIGERRIHAMIDRGNHASAAVASRLGLTRREAIVHPVTGRRFDVHAIDLPAES